MKKRRIALWSLPVFLLLTAFVALKYSHAYVDIPDDLSPEGVVYKTFECWNRGYDKGLARLFDEDCNISIHSSSAACFYCGVICSDAVIGELKEIPLSSSYNDIHTELDDRHIYMVRWNEDMSSEGWRGNGFAFFLVARDDENSPYRIYSMFTGF